MWIDFVAYNQHAIESIPTDMEAVIGEIGKVVFAGSPVPMLRILPDVLPYGRCDRSFGVVMK